MLVAVLILAIVEGLTEFLPISSTGHLVVASALLEFKPAWREVFLVVIQLGAIAAVVVLRRAELLALFARGPKTIVEVGTKLFLGFFPSAILGLLVHDQISALLESPRGVAAAFVVGGILILIVDRPRAAPAAGSELIDPLDTVTYKQAFLVGLAQCLALWPGMSRSGSTIIGGIAVGLDRRAATLFSFYLAIPTMIAAAGYDLLKYRDRLSGAGLEFAVGMIVAFVVAWATIRWFIGFVQSHTFRGFAVYRLVAGVLVFFFVPDEWLKD